MLREKEQEQWRALMDEEEDLDADSDATTDRVRYRMPLFVGDNIVLTMTVKMASEQLTLTNQSTRCEDRVYMVRIKLTGDPPA